MAIPDPPKAGSPFSPLWTGGWNPKTPKINNFFIPETLGGGGLPDLCPSPQRGEIYKWHQSAECEPAGRCPALRTTLWLKHIQGPPAPEAGWSPF